MFKIKKILGMLSVFVLFVGITFAYKASSEDEAFVAKIKTSVNQNIQSDSNTKFAIMDRYYLFHQIQKQQTPGTRTDRIVKEVKTHLRSEIDDLKKLKTEERITNEQFFLSQYQSKITSDSKKLSDRCFEYEDIIDDWAWVYDIPPSLVVATWQIEASCNYSAYQNGIFQISSKNYTGDMTESRFVQELQDFGEFINNKRKWYNDKNSKDGLLVGLSYANINYEGIVRNGALYNGLSGSTVYGDIQPMNKNYVFGNFGEGNDYKKDGMMIDVLKAIGE